MILGIVYRASLAIFWVLRDDCNDICFALQTRFHGCLCTVPWHGQIPNCSLPEALNLVGSYVILLRYSLLFQLMLITAIAIERCRQ